MTTPGPTRTDLGVVAAAAVVAHHQALLAGAVYDDPMILGAAIVKDWSHALDVFSPPAYFDLATGAAELSWRPIATLTHLLDTAFFGTGTFWPHLVNVVLHAIAAALLVRVAAGFGWSRLAAGVAGLVFAVHPLASEAVGVITFREDLLAAVGLLAATWLVLPPAAAAAPGRLVGAGACVLAACGAKEVALPYPLLMAVAAWCVPGDEPIRARLARWVLPGAVAVALYLPLRFLVFVPTWDQGWTGHPGGGGLATLATMGAVLARYVGLCAWPVRLSIDHNPAEASLADPVALLGLALAGGAVACGAWAWRRAPRAALALAFAVAFLLPVCDILPLANIMAERYCYLPLAGAALGLGLLADTLAARAGTRRPALAAVGVCVCALLACRTMARETVFRDSDTLWTHTAATDPSSFRAALGLAKRLEDAALDLPKLGAALEALASAERVRGEPFVGGEGRAEYVAARDRLQTLVARAATGAGGDPEALMDARAGLRIALTREAGERAPPWSQEEAVCWRGLGHVWQEQGRELDGRLRRLRRELEAITAAIDERQKAGHDTTLLQARFDALVARIEALQPLRDAALAEARRWLEQALPRVPDPIRALAHEGLTVIAGVQGDLDRAEAHARAVLTLLPGRGLAAFNLGVVTRDRALAVEDGAARVEGLTRAMEWFRRAQDDPESAQMGFMNEYQLFAQKQLPNEFPDWDPVFDRWRRLADGFADDLEFRMGLADELARTHRFAAAEVELRWILARDPQRGVTWLRLYQVCSVARPQEQGGSGFGKPVEALAILDEAMRVTPDAFRRAAGDPEGLVVQQAAIVARVAVGEILQRDPKRPSALAALGWAFRGMGLPQNAQPMLAAARAADGQAAIRWQLDRDDAAIVEELRASAEQSRVFDKGTIPEWLAAADAERRLGNLAGARQLLEKAREAAAASEGARQEWLQPGGPRRLAAAYQVIDIGTHGTAEDLQAGIAEVEARLDVRDGRPDPFAAGDAIFLATTLRFRHPDLAARLAIDRRLEAWRARLHGPIEPLLAAAREAEAAGALGQAILPLRQARTLHPEAARRLDVHGALRKIFERLPKVAAGE